MSKYTPSFQIKMRLQYSYYAGVSTKGIDYVCAYTLQYSV